MHKLPIQRYRFSIDQVENKLTHVYFNSLGIKTQIIAATSFWNKTSYVYCLANKNLLVVFEKSKAQFLLFYPKKIDYRKKLFFRV